MLLDDHKNRSIYKMDNNQILYYSFFKCGINWQRNVTQPEYMDICQPIFMIER